MARPIPELAPVKKMRFIRPTSCSAATTQSRDRRGRSRRPSFASQKGQLVELLSARGTAGGCHPQRCGGLLPRLPLRPWVRLRARPFRPLQVATSRSSKLRDTRTPSLLELADQTPHRAKGKQGPRRDYKAQPAHHSERRAELVFGNRIAGDAEAVEVLLAASGGAE